MYILVVMLPLISSLIVGLAGRWLGRQAGIIFSVLLLFITWVIANFIFFEVYLSQTIVYVHLYSWILIDIYMLILNYYLTRLVVHVNCCYFNFFISSFILNCLYVTWPSYITIHVLFI